MRTRLRSKTRLLFIVCVALLSVAGTATAITADPSGNTAPAPTIQSDKDDYAPGETVTLTGANWQPGESVHINVNDDEGSTWSRNVDVTADENGAIRDEFQLPDWLVATYKVTATGTQSGVATTSFTDGNIVIKAAPPGTTFNGTFTEYNGTNCTGTVTSSTSRSSTDTPPDPVGSANNNDFSQAVPNTSSLKIEASATNSAGNGFKDFTAEVAADSSSIIENGSFDPASSPRIICINGAFTGGKTFFANYFTSNQAPVNSVPGNQSTNEDTALTFNSANSNLISISDVDAGSNAVKVTLGVTHGKLTLSGTGGLTFAAGSSNGTANMTFTGTIANINSALSGLKFDPDANYNGSTALTITTDDQGNTGTGGAKTDTDTVNITVNAVNDAPVGNAQPVSTDEDTAQSITLSATDVDGDNLTFSIVAGLNHGTLGSIGAVTCTGTAPKNCCASVTYTPNNNYNSLDSGPDHFTFKANDGTTDSSPVPVPIFVRPVNDAPDATNDTATTDEDTAVTIDVKANDTDVDQGDTLTITNVTTPANGTAVVDNGQVKYTLAPNYNGPDSFSYTISDGNGGTDTATVNIDVISVNDKPVATNDTKSTPEDTALNDIDVLSNDTDVDGDTLSVTSLGTASHGTASLDNNGKVNYTPTSNYNGPDSFSYTVSDGNGETATATVNVTVTPVNDVPSVGDITGASSAIEGESKTYTVTGTDDDGDTLTYAWTVKSGAANANITSGAATHTATVKFLDGPGSVNLQVVVSDGHGGQVTKNLDSNLISVTNVDPDITSFTSTPYFFGPLSFLGNTPNASKFSGALTDPGADTWTAQLDYQDGTPLTQTLGPLTARLFSDQGHTFASAGCKSTSLKVADDDTGFDTATTTTNVGTGAFMPPMTNQPVTDKLKNGQVLPVKVKFTDCSGAPLTNLTPAIRLVQGDQTPASDDSTAAITPGSVSAADTLGIMRSNGDGSYIYNMSVNITLNKDYTVMVYPYGTNDPRKLAHVIQATK